jgi:hypothetical protein
MTTKDSVLAAYMRARSCTDADLANAERLLAESPEDLIARATVMGCKLARDMHGFLTGAEYAEHLLWLARQRPESVLWMQVCGFERVTRSSALHQQLTLIWTEHVAADDAPSSVLKNAASFFRMSNPSRAIELLKRGAIREPNVHDWPFQIGMIDLGQARARGRKLTESDPLPDALFDATKAREALVWFDRASLLLSRHESPEWIDIARIQAAMGSGAWDRAQELSIALLSFKGSWRTPPFTGNVVFTANRCLGHVALRGGDVARSKDHLLASARCGSSPQLSSFGPNMTLARELLVRGEREVVLQFFEACAAFWKMDHGQLADWRAAVERGEMPDFRASLFY